MKPFDVLKAPLAGTNLIEASAGTGKTYTIEGIFLRMVLEREMSPGSILVVTFTQAATDELKERIYRKLVAARRVFDGGRTEDDFIKQLAAVCADPARGRRLIQQAVSEFDQAAIFTIHGFCQRVLYENAFETGNLFDTALIEDQTFLARRIAQDFWRRHLYAAPAEVIAYVTRQLPGPEALVSLLQNAAGPHIRILPRFEHEPELRHLAPFRRAAEELKRQWPQARAAVHQAFFDPALSGTTYGSLKQDSEAGGISRRARKAADLISGMDEMVAAGVFLPPLRGDFDKFTTVALRRATRKGHTPPLNPFFEICDGLQAVASGLNAELDAYLAWLKTRMVETFRSQLPDRKRALNVQSFDDLLFRVHQALGAGSGEALAEAVRRKYQAALIDEFQDTDSIQYDIFARIFNRSGIPLFLIGDPKQAIYGFRGADIFTYMQAARQSPHRYTLRENWRSSSGLIAAVNAVFTSTGAPFLFEGIPFVTGFGGNRQREAPGAPMTVWYLDSREHGVQGRPVAKGTAEPLIAEAVSTEVARLLGDASSGLGGGDIAVLVRTNRQARLMKRSLTGHGIPAVLHSTGNLFDAPEAAELEAILRCIATPADSRALRAALVTQMWGHSAETLLACNTDPEQWQALQQRVLDYHRIWQDRGFMPMLRQLLAGENMAVGLMRLPDGERRLTNILHLGEVLHQAAGELNLSVPALVGWLSAQRNPSAPRIEAHQLRLESDAAAVRIVTIHKSKGLEYRVVFCPFGWQDSRVRGDALRYHDPLEAHRPTLHLNAPPDDDCRLWAQNELLAENLRLLYVALTRAKSRCYLVWGRIRSAETSALAYLFHGGAAAAPDKHLSDAVGSLASVMAAKTDDDYLQDLNALATRCPDSLVVAPLPTTRLTYRQKAPDPVALTARNFCGAIYRRRSIVSYSALVTQPAATDDMPDHDEAPALDQMPLLPAEDGGEPDAGSPPLDMFRFPKGARAGLFFHDVFEQMEFAAGAQAARRELVGRKLTEYGFDSFWQDPVHRMLEQVLGIDLPAGETAINLGRLTPAERIHEMEFYFPLKTLTLSVLNRLLQSTPGRLQKTADPKRVADLNFAPARGFMKGFVDLVFEHEDNYYVVDWKSNHLGDTRSDYHGDRLQQVMTAQFYDLQALIYTLAVDQYLRRRRRDYAYQSHFGGVFYIFLRGVSMRWGPQYGIHASRAEPEALQALRDALIPDSAGQAR